MQLEDSRSDPTGTNPHPGCDPAPFFTVEEITARWFRPESTANTAKTNRDNVRELISTGAIPARKIGRRWYVHVSTVETYETGRDDPAVMRRISTGGSE